MVHFLRTRTGMRWLHLAALVSLGCAEGVLSTSERRGDPPDELVSSPPGTPPGGGERAAAAPSALTVTAPSEGEVIGGSRVEVTGLAPGATAVQVNGSEATLEGAAFRATITLPEGAHTLLVETDDGRRAERNALVDLTPPTLEIAHADDFVVEPARVARVEGRAADAVAGLTSVEVAGRSVPVDADGRFSTEVEVPPGPGRVEIVARDAAGHATKRVRGVLRGAFRAWGQAPTPELVLHAAPQVFTTVAHAVEAQLAAGALDAVLAPLMGRNGDLEVHRYEVQRYEVELQPEPGGLRARLRLHGLGVHFTYHYFLGRIRGWARANPARVTATLRLSLGNDGSLAGDIGDTSVDLDGFDLDLDGIYSVVEGLAEGFVRDLATDAIRGALRDLVLGELLDPDLLRQRVQLLGAELEVGLVLDALDLGPTGASARASARVEPLAPTRDGPGVYHTPEPARPGPGARAVALGLSDDFLNELFSQAWRAGLLDQDLAEVLGESGQAPVPLVCGTFIGLTGGALADHCAPGDPVGLRIRAPLPPVVSFDPAAPGAVVVDLPGLLLDLTLPGPAGPTPFATFALFVRLVATPRFDGDAIHLDLAVEATAHGDAQPIFPFDPTGLEQLLGRLLADAPGLLGLDAIDALFDLGSVDLFGLRLSGVTAETPAESPDFLRLSVDVTR